MSNPQEQLGARINANSNASLTSQAIPRNQWVFVYFTYNRSSIDVGYSLYGSSTFSSNMASFTTAISSTPNVYIALGRRFHSGSEEWFKGKMQDVKIYNRKLTSSELGTVRDEINLNSYYKQAEINNKSVLTSPSFSQVVVPNGLTAWYPLNGDTKDYTGNNHGTISGAVINSEGIAGKLAKEFDGNTSYIALGSPLQVYDNTFTVSMWVRHNGSKRGVLLGDYNIAGGVNVNFELTADNKLRMYWGGSPDIAGTSAVSPNTWNHIAFVRSSSQVRFYINGFLDTTYSGSLANKFPTIGPYLGRDSRTGTTAFKGRIQNVKIYNRDLSVGEIQSIYDVERIAGNCEITKDNIYTPGEFKIL